MNEHNKIGLFSAICILIGGCIGSAIYSLSGMTMYYAGPSSILSWIIAGFIQGSYGIQVSELSARYPLSGGVYVFPSKAINKFWGFIAAWGYIIANFIAVSFAAIYIGTYLSVSFPIFIQYRVYLAVLTIVFTAIFNIYGIRNTGKLNNILVFFLISTMIIFSFIALKSKNFNIENFSPFFYGARGKLGFLEAVPNAMVGYGSVVGIAFMVGEVKKPNRTVPLSMLIAMVVVMSLYVLIIVSTLGHVTVSYLSDNPRMRFIPLFAASRLSLYNTPWLTKLISLSAFFALITTMLVVQYLNALAIRAVVKDNALPKMIAYSNKYSSPTGAIILSASISIILSLKPSLTELLVNLASLTSCVTIVIVIASLIKSRKYQPLVDDNYKAIGGNCLSYVVILMILISYIPSIINKNIGMWVFTVIVYIVGIVIFTFSSEMLKRRNIPLYVYSGIVVHGKGMGRTVGMRTANVCNDNHIQIPFGVYASIIEIGKEKFLAVTNVGTRPSVDNDSLVTVEAHILDFDRDIYDKEVTIKFYKYIRDIKKFNSLNEVKKQVDIDIQFTRNVLSCV